MIGATTLHGLLNKKEGLGYGYLYNWYAATDANFCPTDCHLPTLTEWQTLSTFLGGDSVSGGKLKEVGTTHWTSPNTGATDDYGFSAFGGGARYPTGSFGGLKGSGLFWTSTVFDATRARDVLLLNTTAETNFNAWDFQRGYSIRLLYTGSSSTVSDYNGNVYNIITIGTQKWLKQNFKCTHLNNGTAIPNVTDNTTWAGLTTGARCAYSNDEDNV